MSETNMTLADIVAEMRRGTKLPGYWRSCDLNEILKYHADRIEAAWKRDKAKTEADALAAGGIVEAARERKMSKTRPKNAADFGQFGNAAAMREAVVLALSLLDLKDGVPYKTINKKDIDFMKAALAAPPRNCDVGTVEEQTKRFRRFCNNTKCQYCNITVNKGSCSFNWAQMPYNEEGGAK